MSQMITIKQNTDFHRAYSRGKVKTAPALVTYVRKNRLGCCRIGITASKKLGSAVERNRCRRIIRAAYAALSPECSGSYDIVFVARFKTKGLKSTEICPVMRSQLMQLNVITGERDKTLR